MNRDQLVDLFIEQTALINVDPERIAKHRTPAAIADLFAESWATA